MVVVYLARWSLATLVVLLSMASASPRIDAQSAGSPQRLVAIGDVHGAFDALTTILRKAGLVDDRLRWAGGRAVLVQTGDYLDRGTDVRKVMDLFMQLEKDARAAGGQAIVLAGNHEMMGLMNDLRDVTPEICATFATPNSARKLEDTWRQYERIAAERAKTLSSLPAVYAKTREAWFDAHPPGCLEYREAMSPRGTYGRWLRAKDIAAVVDGTLFMHAGLNPSRPAPLSIADVNARARAEVRRLDAYRRRLADKRLALETFDLQEVLDVSIVELQVATAALERAKAEGGDPPALDVPLLREAQEMTAIGQWSLVDPEGPLWFRGYAQSPEDSTTSQVTAFMDRMKLSRIVVGHTPTPDRRIASRYGGRVLVIDTGMLAAYYKGQPSALEITPGRLKAIYPNGEVDLTPATAAADAGRH
jgi:hypothetical protein